MHLSPLYIIPFLSAIALADSALSLKAAAPQSGTFSDVLIFDPPADYTDPRTLYARTTLLSNGDLLATWENYSPEPPPVYFPIYKSTNGGESWTPISKVQDQVNGWGLRYQPFLYELPRAIGGYPAGTILLAGNSIPTDLSKTQIDLYASCDKGVTWKFVSHIASGGRAIPDNGETPVWEPFIIMYKGQIVVYYSDQRDSAHCQKLVHQVSSDLKTWEAPVDDVTYANDTARPGMPTVTHLPDGNYMMTYEYGGGPGFSNYSFPAYYRINKNPLNFNQSVGLPIISKDGTQPISSPYVTWSPVGGKNGTIAVSTGSHSEIFVNQALGALDQWVKVPTAEKISYTRHLRVLPNPDHLLIMGGGVLPPSTTNNVTVSVIDMKSSIAAA